MERDNTLRIALAQVNTIVGDLDGNARLVSTYIERAKSDGCQLICFPELTLTGYPPEDLLLKSSFIQDQRNVLDRLIQNIENITAVIGFVHEENGALYNSAAVIQDRRLSGIYHKVQLPNYSVFDEERYFEPGDSPLVVETQGIMIGISICEDIWVPQAVTEAEALLGKAEILLNISASPYSLGKRQERKQLMQNRAQQNSAIVVYNNLVGGQDELVFDGQSMIVGYDGTVLAEGAPFKEDYLVYDLDVAPVREARKEISFQHRVNNFKSNLSRCRFINLKYSDQPIERKRLTAIPQVKPMAREEEIYNALILGLYDYVNKNGFKSVVFGLSGGIDSALVAVIAADALGPENVNGITMPSQFSSVGSVDDSVTLANNLGINLHKIGIKEMFDVYLEKLQPFFNELEPDIAEENLQARIRGNLVMAFSNKFGWLPLATGNKSEVSVGYCTIYGDMVGGFAPLKDVTKTLVYGLSEYRNKIAGRDLIPREIIEKPPSAELRPDQTDQDSLPPYDELDQILELYIEKRLCVKEIVERGFSAETAHQVALLVDINEYKRRQAAPGVKITPIAFGKDRRMPITNHYKGR